MEPSSRKFFILGGVAILLWWLWRKKCQCDETTAATSSRPQPLADATVRDTAIAARAPNPCMVPPQSIPERYASGITADQCRGLGGPSRISGAYCFFGDIDNEQSLPIIQPAPDPPITSNVTVTRQPDGSALPYLRVNGL